MLFLPDTKAKYAQEITERIRIAIENKTLLTDNSKFSITASFGIATYQMDESTGANIDRAGHALYSAKENGRNKTVLSESAQKSEYSI